jgi:hypothetical protein
MKGQYLYNKTNYKYSGWHGAPSIEEVKYKKFNFYTYPRQQEFFEYIYLLKKCGAAFFRDQ